MRAPVREREVKLAAPPGFRLLDLGAIADDVVVTAGPERRLTTVYWDTPDLRLIRWGCTLRYRAGEGWTVKLPQSSDGDGGLGVLTRDEHTFEGEPTSPPRAAVDLVFAYVRTAPLVQVARMRTVRRVVTLMSADGQRLAEIDDDEVSVYDGRRLASRFREIEVEVAEEAPVELLPGVIERLHAGGAGAIDPTPKVVRALGARALAEPEVVVANLGPGATAGDAVRRAIAASVVRLMRHDPIARLGTDPEGVHQARVATRRLRSDLRTFRSLLDTEWSEPLRDELRWLGGELGAVRDAEVLRDLLRDTAADHLPEADLAAAAEIAEALAESVHNARQHLLASMRTRRFAVLLDRLVDAAANPRLLAAANAPARSVVPRLVASPWSRLKKAARGLDEESPAEELHDLRIRAKRCRYAAEAVAPVVGRRAAAFARDVAALQQVLGDFHDAIVAEAWLREYVTSRQPDSRIAFVAGELCGVEQATAKSLRSAWPAVWKRASRKENRTWM